MLGVNFNRASADAVQALHVLTREARQVETRVASGLKVADPRDNGAVYAIAMGQKSSAPARMRPKPTKPERKIHVGFTVNARTAPVSARVPAMI